ncbi:hypothetical protein ABPG74_020539 [Tetrahymena malaccensis]
MINLNIEDQVKGWNGSYFDFTHFNGKLENLQDGEYNQGVLINIIANKQMQNVNEGMKFLCNELRSNKFKSITNLKIVISSYKNNIIKSFYDLRSSLSQLQKLVNLDITLKYHTLSDDQIIDLILNSLDYKILIDFQLEVQDSGNYTYKSTYDHNNQILKISTSDMSDIMNSQIIEFLGSKYDLKQIIFNQQLDLYSQEFLKCIILNKIKAIQNFMLGQQQNANSQNLYLLDLKLDGNGYCTCISHQDFQKYKNLIKKKLKRLVKLSI